MARVTVEDCVLIIENRFELVALASKRAKDIAAGAPIAPGITRDNDKDPVIALREIADSKMDVKELRNNFVDSLRKRLKSSNNDNVKLDDNISKEVEEEMQSMNDVVLAKDADEDNLFSDEADIDD